MTSTKNASLIIIDFLAMIYKNEHPDDVVQAQRTYDGIVHRSLMFQYEFALSLC